jgi:hypothetical protein
MSKLTTRFEIVCGTDWRRLDVVEQDSQNSETGTAYRGSRIDLSSGIDHLLLLFDHATGLKDEEISTPRRNA